MTSLFVTDFVGELGVDHGILDALVAEPVVNEHHVGIDVQHVDSD